MSAPKIIDNLIAIIIIVHAVLTYLTVIMHFRNLATLGHSTTFNSGIVTMAFNAMPIGIVAF